MERTLAVKGTGKLSLRPDNIEVSLMIRQQDRDYAAAMIASSKQQEALRESLVGVGFRPEALKTSSFNVRTEYESMRDEKGVYRQVFAGYVCEHMMSLSFPFDTEVLSSALSAMALCVADPEINVSFTIKDREAATDTLLRNAAENARERAQLLAEASGVELGEILSIEYGRRELDFVSPTRFVNNAKLMTRGAEAAVAMDVAPQSIDLEESVQYVWSIK